MLVDLGQLKPVASISVFFCLFPPSSCCLDVLFEVVGAGVER